MKTALITGGTGFIGRHVVPTLLQRGYCVHALVPEFETPPPAADGIVWHQADIMNAAAMRDLVAAVRPTHLLHLAWTTKHGAFWQSADNLDWVAASLSLLQAFGEHGGTRFVAAGSCAEYQWTGKVCDERKTALCPASLYGASKKALSEILAAYAPGAGLTWAWGRVFFLYGPGENDARLVPYLIRNSLNKQPAVCRNAQFERDYMHVADVADAFAAVLDGAVEGPINIASGAPARLGLIAETIARSCGAENVLDLRQEPPKPGEPLCLVAAVDRLRDEVGWRPQYDLPTGIAQTVAWWRKKLDFTEL